MERTAPVITTERLILRPHRPDDLPAQAAMWADSRVTRYIGSGAASTRTQSWARMLAYAGHWNLCGFGYWAVADRASDRFIGEAGMANFERGLFPAFDALPELGFAFAAEVHGRGIARETVAAVLAWADARPGFERTACLVDDRNIASLRVVRRCGYIYETSVQIAQMPSSFFVRDRAAR